MESCYICPMRPLSLAPHLIHCDRGRRVDQSIRNLTRHQQGDRGAGDLRSERVLRLPNHVPKWSTGQCHDMVVWSKFPLPKADKVTFWISWLFFHPPFFWIRYRQGRGAHVELQEAARNLTYSEERIGVNTRQETLAVQASQTNSLQLSQPQNTWRHQLS